MIGLAALWTATVIGRQFGPIPQGSIRTDDYKIEKRDANGNVEGTEFVHFEFKVSLEVRPQAPDVANATNSVECVNECQGKKHPEHSKCDLSCDKKCQRDHKLTITGKYVPDTNEQDRLTQESAKLAKAATSQVGPADWSSAYSNALRQIKQACDKAKLTFTPPHVPNPCATVERLYGRIQYDIIVSGEFHKVGFYMSRGVRTPIDANLGNLSGVVARAYLPSGTPLWKGDPWVVCKCKFVPEPQPPVDPKTPKELIHRCTPTYSGLGWRKPDGTVEIPPGKDIHIDCHGKSLTRAELEVRNDSGVAYHVCAPPGTLLIPDDGGTQVMVNMEEQEMMCQAVPDWIRNIGFHGPAALETANMELSVACTELMKHQPSERTKLTIVPPNDDRLTQLATMFARTNFHVGGLDQARIWIYKDHAPIGEINKRMIPGVSEGKYLEALYDVGTAGVDLDDKAYQGCHDVKLLSGTTASREAVIWAIKWWTEHDKKALLQQVKKMASALGQSDNDNQTARHLADIAAGLTQSSDVEVQAAGVIWLESVPAALRGRVLEYDGLMYFADCLGTGQEALTVGSLAILRGYSAKSFADQARALACYGATDKIKAAAGETATALGG